MKILRGAITVFLFECRRAMSPARLACWLVLVLFPPAVVGVMAYFGAGEDQNALLIWTGTMFFLIPEVICLLGLLLWATPAIHSELEGQTWIYLAVRPDGKRSVLLGKYLTAVAWTAAAGLLAATLSVLIAWPPEMTRLLGSLLCLVILSSLTYGAIYILIGVLFLKRAMVIAVFYTLVLELIVAFIPAVINNFTVQYRLRSLMFQWMQPVIGPGEIDAQAVDLFFSLRSPDQQVAILLGMTALLLTAAVTVLEQRQLTTVTEV